MSLLDLTGPTIEYIDGHKEWYQNDQPPRPNEPATTECADGLNVWYREGKLNRLDGAAVEYPNRDRDWIINEEE
jgi:hypothetical protein